MSGFQGRSECSGEETHLLPVPRIEPRSLGRPVTSPVTIPTLLLTFSTGPSRRWDVGMWTGLGWPRIGTGGVRL